MTQTFTQTTEPVRPARAAPTPPGRRRRRIVAVIVSTTLLVAIASAAYVIISDGGDDGQTADMSAQGSPDEVIHENAATLSRRADGLFAAVDIPTPAPGSYDYPTSDQVPPGFDPHPQVASGASDAPEVFTAWLFVFNFPDQCTDSQCDSDDLGPDTPAQGGIFQLDARIADGDRLELRGGVRTGQEAASGVRLEQPVDAEVHVALAPHGRALPGNDGWRQLNEPVGNPDFWWSASFLP